MITDFIVQELLREKKNLWYSQEVYLLFRDLDITL